MNLKKKEDYTISFNGKLYDLGQGRHLNIEDKWYTMSKPTFNRRMLWSYIMGLVVGGVGVWLIV